MTIDGWCEEIAAKIDEKAFDFLNENGYKIEKPYTREKALQIAEQLKRDGKKLTHEAEVEKIVINDDGSYNAITKVKFKLEELSK